MHLCKVENFSYGFIASRGEEKTTKVQGKDPVYAAVAKPFLSEPVTAKGKKEARKRKQEKIQSNTLS